MSDSENNGDRTTSSLGSRSPRLRFTRGARCPVCGGSDDDPRGEGVRCHGYVQNDWIHCSREYFAGQAKFDPKSQTWSHRSKGKCPCGDEHAPSDFLLKRKAAAGTIDRVYKYRDEQGIVLHETVRYRDPKRFLQRRPSPPGKHIWSLSGIRRLLYNLPELMVTPRGSTIFVVEGEKDCDRLGTLGLVATCNPMGAGKWLDVAADARAALHNQHIVILADNDQAGLDHANQVAADVADKAASVKVVLLPGLQPKGDVSDWLDAGHTKEELLGIIAAASPWLKPEHEAAAQSTEATAPPEGTIDYASLTPEELGITCATDVAIKPIEWVWEYRIAACEMTLLAGEPGLGKSQILLAIAAAISSGSEWPDKNGSAPQGSVIILSAEDSPETTIVPRLKAMGANLTKIFILKPKVVLKRTGKETRILPKSFKDLDWWNHVIDRIPDAKMIIADPVVSYLGRGVNDGRNTEIREILEPFLEGVIRTNGLSFVGNTHLNKSLDSKSPLNRVSGSTAYGALPRNVHFVIKDPDEPGVRYFKQCKCNNAPDDLDAIQFTVESRVLELGGLSIETSIPIFGDPVPVDLSSMMSGPNGKRGPKPVRKDKVTRWLFDLLCDGPIWMRDLVERARTDGLLRQPTANDPKPSIATLYDAMKHIPVLYPKCSVNQSEVEPEPGKPGRSRKYWTLIRPDDFAAKTGRFPF